MNWFCNVIFNMDTSDYIALAGVLCTGLFSWLLWKTTKKIGNKQNELQENQTKLQEYHYKLESNKAYRNLYLCLTDVKQICDEFFYFIEIGIMSIVDERERQYVQSFYERVEELNKEIKACRVDMELQLTGYPYLTHDLDMLYISMYSIQLNIKSIQMPLKLIEKNDYRQTEILKKIIQTVNSKIPNYYININTDINNLSDNDYYNILNETRKIMVNGSWQMEKFVDNTDNEIIKHISDELSCLTDNVSIESWCNKFVEIREKIFTKYNVLDIVKEKCVLK